MVGKVLHENSRPVFEVGVIHLVERMGLEKELWWGLFENVVSRTLILALWASVMPMSVTRFRPPIPRKSESITQCERKQAGQRSSTIRGGVIATLTVALFGSLSTKPKLKQHRKEN